jgi:hypothetical protein
MRIADSSIRHSTDMTVMAIRATEFATNAVELDAGVSRFTLTGTAIDEMDARRRLGLAEAAFVEALQQQGMAVGDAAVFRTAFSVTKSPSK